MRYVFIINPTAGKKNPQGWIQEKIEQELKPKGMDCRLYTTTQPGHATEIARQEAEKGDSVRIMACGGDGTVCEVSRGVMGYPNAVLGIFPCGSGNDYIKIFGKKELFCSLISQHEGKTVPVDMIRAGDEYAVNLCSLGVDAKVGESMTRFKNLPLVSGPAAYNMAVIKVLFGRMYDRLHITIDDAIHYEGDFFFALAGSGQFYGGGYHGAPEAIPDDGLLDFVLIKSTNKLKILDILPRYKRGDHRTDDFGGLVFKHRGKKMEVRSLSQEPAAVNLDGETSRRSEITFEVVPKAIHLLLPKGITGG